MNANEKCMMLAAEGFAHCRLAVFDFRSGNARRRAYYSREHENAAIDCADRIIALRTAEQAQYDDNQRHLALCAKDGAL